MNRKPIQSHHQLEVYQLAFEVAMRIFELSKQFPIEEKYSLTDQIRRSSRSVCANLTEAWRKRRYEAAFISKLSDAEAERLQRHRPGYNSPLNVAIFRRTLAKNSIRFMTRSSGNL